MCLLAGSSRLCPGCPGGQSSTGFGGGHQDFLPEQVSTAFSGAEHVHGSPVPSERPVCGRLHGSAGQSSTARRGAHLHELLPEDVVDEELQERMAAQWRGPVLRCSSCNGPSCMTGRASGVKPPLNPLSLKTLMPPPLSLSSH